MNRRDSSVVLRGELIILPHRSKGNKGPHRADLFLVFYDRSVAGCHAARWRNNLIDLTRRNPLLALKPGRGSCLDIKEPDLAALFKHLVLDNKTYTFYLPPVPGEPGGVTGTTAKKGMQSPQSIPPRPSC